MKLLFTTAFTASLLFSTQAFSSDNDGKFAIGVGVGTTGPSLSATYKLNNHFNLRGIYAQYDRSETEIESGITYDLKIELETFSLLLDYHPFKSSGFRFSAGAVKNGTEFSGTSTQSTGNITVGNTTFSASDVGTLNASVSYDSIAPYFGIGWGNAVLKNRNLSFAFDLGVITMGNPEVNLTSSSTNPAIQSALNTEIERERQELTDSIDEFDLYPVLNLSVNYKF
jgi:hypothetical protein